MKRLQIVRVTVIENVICRAYLNDVSLTTETSGPYCDIVIEDLTHSAE